MTRFDAGQEVKVEPKVFSKYRCHNSTVFRGWQYPLMNLVPALKETTKKRAPKPGFHHLNFNAKNFD